MKAVPRESSIVSNYQSKKTIGTESRRSTNNIDVGTEITERISSGFGLSLPEDDKDPIPPPPPLSCGIRPTSALKGDATKAAILLQAYWR